MIYAALVYPSIDFLQMLNLTLLKLVYFTLSLNLQIYTDHILRLTSASTEMHEQCPFGNALSLLKTGVLRYTSIDPCILPHQFHCTSCYLISLILA